jgi:hypothetical protein
VVDALLHIGGVLREIFGGAVIALIEIIVRDIIKPIYKDGIGFSVPWWDAERPVVGFSVPWWDAWAIRP